MIFSGTVTFPALPGMPPSAVFTYDDSAPGVIVGTVGEQSMQFNCYFVASDFGAALASGGLSVVPVPCDGVQSINLVDASGAVKAHLSSGAAVWSPPVVWSAASVEHDGAGKFRVVGGGAVLALN